MSFESLRPLISLDNNPIIDEFSRPVIGMRVYIKPKHLKLRGTCVIRIRSVDLNAVEL